MGFRTMFALVDAWLLRNLCYWLASCVDVKNNELFSSNGVRFPLSKIQIHWVLGLPLGQKKVPKEASNCKIDRIWDFYGTKTSSGKRPIEGKTLVNEVIDPDVSEAEFKRAFLMFALNEVLFPTQFYGLSSKLLPAVTVFNQASECDWFGLVFEHRLFYLKNFEKSFETYGFASGCAGCTIFLVVFYLDRLKRKPTAWGLRPRTKY